MTRPVAASLDRCLMVGRVGGGGTRTLVLVLVLVLVLAAWWNASSSVGLRVCWAITEIKNRDSKRFWSVVVDILSKI